MVRAHEASSERIASWAAGFGGLALSVPILATRYPPMGDLAMHEGAIAIMRHLHDPSWFPPGLYYVVVPQANQLFPIAALALSFVLPTDLACKVLVAAIVIATPVLAARLLARLGLSRWLALLIGPISCGSMFRWGLVANLAGFALFLFSIPELERLARRPSGAAVLRATACGGALFLAHESSALIFAAMAAAFAVLHSSSWRSFAARLAPVGATAALTVLQWDASERLLGARMRSIGTDYGAEALDRLAILPGAVFGGMSAGREAAIGGVWIAAAAASALFGKGGARDAFRCGRRCGVTAMPSSPPGSSSSTSCSPCRSGERRSSRTGSSPPRASVSRLRAREGRRHCRRLSWRQSARS